MNSTHSWIFCRSSWSDGGLFLYIFFKQLQQKGLEMSIVFNNTSRLHSGKRHVCRPAVLKPLLGHVTCDLPHTASAQLCQHIHPTIHLYRIPSQLVKVKVTLVQALRLCKGCTALGRSRGIALTFHDNSTRRGWGVSVTPRPLFTPGKDPVPIVQEAGWAPEPVWTGAENLASTGIRSPDRPARSQSLYRLSYPVHFPASTIYQTSRWASLRLFCTKYTA